MSKCLPDQSVSVGGNGRRNAMFRVSEMKHAHYPLPTAARNDLPGAKKKTGGRRQNSERGGKGMLNDEFLMLNDGR